VTDVTLGWKLIVPEFLKQTFRMSIIVVTDDHVVKGVLGKSPLSSNMLDIVNHVLIDYMHCCLEGIVRSLMNRWFTPSYHDYPYYLGLHRANIDVMLLKQSHPTDYSRSPRSIKLINIGRLLNCTIGYCSTCCCYWLTIYDHLPSLYFHHYALCNAHIAWR